jgi:hypothetical protein
MGRAAILEVVVAGDLVLDAPDAGHWLSGIAPAVRDADLAIGHLEVPHTTRGEELSGDVPAPGAAPENLSAIAQAGFAMVSLGGNHIADRGREGIEDTLAGLDALGVKHAGAGLDLASARQPALVTRGSRRLALLSYNCVGPEAGWAGEGRAGAAYLRVETVDGSPIAPAAPLDRASEEAFAILRADVRAARERADYVLVALHKGLVHVPARLAPYERPLAHAAIDAGADAVLGHHAHIVKGIEFHRGRPIFRQRRSTRPGPSGPSAANACSASSRTRLTTWHRFIPRLSTPCSAGCRGGRTVRCALVRWRCMSSRRDDRSWPLASAQRTSSAISSRSRATPACHRSKSMPMAG